MDLTPLKLCASRSSSTALLYTLGSIIQVSTWALFKRRNKDITAASDAVTMVSKMNGMAQSKCPEQPIQIHSFLNVVSF